MNPYFFNFDSYASSVPFLNIINTLQCQLYTHEKNFQAADSTKK